MLDVTVLTENSPAVGLCNEHGLSLHLAYGAKRVLLDFGQSSAFARNADALGIDLSLVDFAVLSHAHYDHADGMPEFFARNNHAPLYLSAACDETCWSTKGGTADAHYIGIKQGFLAQHANRLVRVPIDRTTTVAPGIHLVPHMTANLDELGAKAGMLIRQNDEWLPDNFAHEISLVFELENDALAIFSSCSHAGLPAIAAEVKAAFPGRGIAAFVGGLHLVHSTDEEILQVAQAIDEDRISHLYTGHCTGDHAFELLARQLPGRVTALHPGLAFSL